MFILRRPLNTEFTHKLTVNRSSHRAGSLIIMGVIMLGLTGCGQKGDLYLTEKPGQNSSQTIVTETASEALDSTSHPQDAAFASIDDADYQKQRYLEQKQVLPAVSDDPNDY
ncbi:LPS translocon maturation chaperone LptM [Psychrobacter jeotgali]|uniref:LPS translocon maturation chaperone LptM n=1 Tax=Psychrobacter jeotgali TaxID=179010 RepID=UPI001918C9D4|nr:lipoprotein [Psychrobacter jeotgali]